MGEIAGTQHAWTAAALVASLIHVLIDYHIGLYGGASSQITSLQAINLLLTGLVYGWWIYAVAIASLGDRSGLVSALILAVLWACVWNGLVGLAVSPPPSSAFPYQDVAHLASIVFGAGAGVTIWQTGRIIETDFSWTMPIATGAVLLAAFVVQSILGLQNA